MTSPRTDPALANARRPVTEYGCALCQKFHRRGLDPEYDAHLHRQAKHHGPRDRPPTCGEVFRRLVEEQS